MAYFGSAAGSMISKLGSSFRRTNSGGTNKVQQEQQEQQRQQQVIMEVKQEVMDDDDIDDGFDNDNISFIDEDSDVICVSDADSMRNMRARAIGSGPLNVARDGQSRSSRRDQVNELVEDQQLETQPKDDNIESSSAQQAAQPPVEEILLADRAPLENENTDSSVRVRTSSTGSADPMPEYSDSSKQDEQLGSSGATLASDDVDGFPAWVRDFTHDEDLMIAERQFTLDDFSVKSALRSFELVIGRDESAKSFFVNLGFMAEVSDYFSEVMAQNEQAKNVVLRISDEEPYKFLLFLRSICPSPTLIEVDESNLDVLTELSLNYGTWHVFAECEKYVSEHMVELEEDQLVTIFKAVTKPELESKRTWIAKRLFEYVADHLPLEQFDSMKEISVNMCLALYKRRARALATQANAANSELALIKGGTSGARNAVQAGKKRGAAPELPAPAEKPVAVKKFKPEDYQACPRCQIIIRERRPNHGYRLVEIKCSNCKRFLCQADCKFTTCNGLCMHAGANGVENREHAAVRNKDRRVSKPKTMLVSPNQAPVSSRVGTSTQVVSPAVGGRGPAAARASAPSSYQLTSPVMQVGRVGRPAAPIAPQTKTLDAVLKAMK